MLSKSGMIKQKTQYCRHRSKSCYKNAVLAFLKYFCYAFVTKTMLAGLAEITGLRFNIMKVIKAMVSSKAINSSFCIASFATAYKLLMWTLRCFRNVDDYTNHIVALMLACNAFLMDGSNSKIVISVAILGKILYSLLKVAKKWFHQKQEKSSWFTPPAILTHLGGFN